MWVKTTIDNTDKMAVYIVTVEREFSPDDGNADPNDEKVQSENEWPGEITDPLDEEFNDGTTQGTAEWEAFLPEGKFMYKSARIKQKQEIEEDWSIKLLDVLSELIEHSS